MQLMTYVMDIVLSFLFLFQKKGMAFVIHEIKVGNEQFKGTSAANIDATRETVIMVPYYYLS